MCDAYIETRHFSMNWVWGHYVQFMALTSLPELIEVSLWKPRGKFEGGKGSILRRVITTCKIWTHWPTQPMTWRNVRHGILRLHFSGQPSWQLCCELWILPWWRGRAISESQREVQHESGSPCQILLKRLWVLLYCAQLKPQSLNWTNIIII